jgi:hypothetical protein
MLDWCSRGVGVDLPVVGRIGNAPVRLCIARGDLGIPRADCRLCLSIGMFYS